jgi:undecaprenyl-diphosphatase
MEYLLGLDEKWLLWLNSLGGKSLDPAMVFISEVYVWVPLYALLIFVLFKKFPTSDALFYLALVIVGVLLTDQISVHAFKEVFQRPRPCHQDHLIGTLRIVDGCGGAYGFVSSHAANTFGLATLLGKILRTKFKWVSPALLIWAAVVSYSRIYLGVHFPGDVLGGAILGMAIGNVLFTIAQRRLLKA